MHQASTSRINNNDTAYQRRSPVWSSLILSPSGKWKVAFALCMAAPDPVSLAGATVCTPRQPYSLGSAVTGVVAMLSRPSGSEDQVRLGPGVSK